MAYTLPTGILDLQVPIFRKKPENTKGVLLHDDPLDRELRAVVERHIWQSESPEVMTRFASLLSEE